MRRVPVQEAPVSSPHGGTQENAIKKGIFCAIFLSANGGVKRVNFCTWLRAGHGPTPYTRWQQGHREEEDADGKAMETVAEPADGDVAYSIFTEYG